MIIQGATGTPLLHAGEPSNGQSSEQTITITGSPSGGSFRLRYEGFITPSLAFDLSASDLETALADLPSIGEGNVSVEEAEDSFVVTFGGELAKLAVSSVQLHSNALTGEGSFDVTIEETQEGMTATERGAAAGAQLIDTTNKITYQNAGTANAPDWQRVGDQGAADAAVRAVEDSSGNLIAGGSVSAPAGEILYGNSGGDGVTSDDGLTRDITSPTNRRGLRLKAVPGIGDNFNFTAFVGDELVDPGVYDPAYSALGNYDNAVIFADTHDGISGVMNSMLMVTKTPATRTEHVQLALLQLDNPTDVIAYNSGASRAEVYHTGVGTLGKMSGFSAYVENYADANAGRVDLAIGFTAEQGYADPSNPVTNLVGFYAYAQLSGDNNFAFYASDMDGAPNGYYEWYDSRGVRRIKEDNKFDSVGQAIEALYNPQFPKYTPGAQAFERGVLGQWNGNVFEIGTEKGPTQTLTSLTSASTTATATKTNHGYRTGDTVTIAGADQEEYDGDYSVTRVDADTFTYTFAGSDTTPATGTITAQSGTLRKVRIIGEELEVVGNLLAANGMNPFRKVISHADMLTLPTSPVELIPDPGPNKAKVWAHIFSIFKGIGTVTNCAGAPLKVGYPNGAGTPVDLASIDILGNGRPQISYVLPGLAGVFNGANSIPLADVSGPLVLYAANEFNDTIDTLTPTGTAAAGTASYDIASNDAFSNSGEGFNATFHVSRAGGVYTVTITGGDSHKGFNFSPGDVLVFLGSALGGADTTNDLTITINTVAHLNENFEGGDADDKLIIEGFYREVDLSTD